jgi:hypothetical protein
LGRRWTEAGPSGHDFRDDALPHIVVRSADSLSLGDGKPIELGQLILLLAGEYRGRVARNLERIVEVHREPGLHLERIDDARLNDVVGHRNAAGKKDQMGTLRVSAVRADERRC